MISNDDFRGAGFNVSHLLIWPNETKHLFDQIMAESLPLSAVQLNNLPVYIYNQSTSWYDLLEDKSILRIYITKYVIYSKKEALQKSD